MMNQPPPPRPRRRRSGAMVVAAVAVAGLLVGGGGGALAGMTTHQPEGPSTLPELPAGFPGTSSQYLPEVTLGSIEEWTTVNEYECETDPDGFDAEAAAHRMDCWGFADASHLVVDYDDDAQVRLAYVTCQRGPRNPESLCRDVYSFFTEAAFAGHPDLQEEAMTWAKDNTQNDAATVFGGILLTTDLGNNTLSLYPGG